MLLSTSTFPSPEAFRQRRYRQRQRDGIVNLPFPISHAEIEKLIESDNLAEAEASDREAMVRAIKRAAGL